MISISLPGETSPSQFREILESAAPPPELPPTPVTESLLGEEVQERLPVGWGLGHQNGSGITSGVAWPEEEFLREDPYPPRFPGSPPFQAQIHCEWSARGTSGSGVPPLDWLPGLLLRSQDGVGAEPPWGRSPSHPLQGIQAVPHCREAELVTPGMLPSLPPAGPEREQSSAQVTDFIKTSGSWGPQCGEGKQRPHARSAVTAKAP